MTIKLLDVLSESFLGFLNTIRGSLSGAYNAVGDLLPAMWELLTGSTDRAHFEMSLIIFYLAPLGFLLPRYAWRLFGDGQKEMPSLLGFSLVLWAFLYVPFWPALLAGFTDLACLIPFLAALGLALNTNITARVERRRMILLGVSLYLCFLLRRWFIFAVGSFYLTYAFVALGTLERNNWSSGLKNIVKNLLTAGITSLVLIMIFQFPVLRGMVFNKYSELYAAFQAPLTVSLGQVYSVTGPVILILAAISPIAALVRKKNVAVNVFALLCPVIYFLSFTRIQGIGTHHTLAITFFIWLLAFGGLVSLYQVLPANFARAVLCLIVTAFMIVGFKGVFSPNLSSAGAAALLPGARIQPVKHPDFAGLKDMLSDLAQLLAGRTDKATFLASTPDLNYDLARNLMGPDFTNNILTSKGIDARDGISVFQLVASRYVIVPDPVHQQLPGSAQFVVTVPADKILKGEGLGRAYHRVGQGYNLGNGVTGYIYEKQRPFTREEVDDYFRSFPPGAENWFRPITEDDKMLMTAVEVISDGQERLPFDKEKKPGLYVIKSGSNPPTSVTLNLEDLQRIKLAFSITSRKKLCGGQVVISVGQPGLPPESISLKAGETEEIEVELASSKRLTISAERDSGVGCDFVLFRILEKH